MFDCSFEQNSAFNLGGAIFSSGGSRPTLTRCSFEDHAAVRGGALYNLSGSHTTLVECTFLRNSVTNYGPAMLCNNSSAEFTDCTFELNSAASSGGAVYVQSGSTLHLTTCSFSQNSSGASGAAVFNTASNITVTGCAFSDHHAPNRGGAIYSVTGEAAISGCEFRDNSVNYDGGAIYSHTSTVTISACTFVGNSAYSGGALFNYLTDADIQHCTFRANHAFLGGAIQNDAGSAPTLTSCLLVKNTADLYGGGVYCDASSVNIHGCTLLANSALSVGGGVFLDDFSTASISNSIFWANLSPLAAQLGGDGSETYDLTHSCLPGAWTGAGNVTIDPLLNPNGRLTSSSPIRELGDPNGDFAGQTDIDGDPRVVNGRIDLGADEWLDSDGDQLPNWWEQEYFGDPNVADPNGNPDGDADDNLAEYERGTDPNLPAAAYYVDPNGDDAWDGVAPQWDGQSGPKATIQAALDACHADRGDEVVVAAGVYTGAGNVNLDFAGKALTLRSASGDPNDCIIDCNGSVGAPARGFYFHSGEGADSIVRGLTIRNGFAPTSNPHAGNGGGIVCALSSPTIERCRIINSHADEVGGGIYTYAASPTYTDCAMVDNVAELRGGGMYNDTGCAPLVVGCEFTRNQADTDPNESYGGAVYNNQYTLPTYERCSFVGNTAAARGGAMYNQTCDPTISDCEFAENTAKRGGGIYNHTSDARISDSTFTGHEAFRGGGVFNYASDADIARCRFTRNRSDIGGAINSIGGSDPTLTNCLFVNNSAGLYAGGVYCDSSSISIRNCTLLANSAISVGGAVYLDDGSTASIEHSIVWSSLAPYNPHLAGDGSETYDLTYSCVPGEWGGLGNVAIEPLLTPHGHLTSSSPVRELGDPNGDFAGQTDIDGDPRVVNGRIDLGADEWLDSDGDQLPNWWEQEYFGDPNVADPNGNPDGDADDNLAEYERGTDPNLPAAAYYVDANGDDAWDGAAPQWDGQSGPKATIQAALDACHADRGDKVVVAAGVYTGAGNVNLDFAGKALTLRSASGDPNDCIIDCNGSVGAPARGFYFHSGEGADSIVRGLTIRNGFAPTSNPHAGDGGGIVCALSSPTIERCRIINSHADNLGGGIYVYSANPTLDQCTLVENVAELGGGGMYNDRASAPLIVGCDFIANHADADPNDSYGGGVYNNEYTLASFDRCQFIQNTGGDRGGAMYSQTCRPTISDCEFAQNTAERGGGIYNHTSDALISDSTFTGHEAFRGGGVFNYASDAQIDRCRFEYNWADIGASIDNGADSAAVISDCLFSANAARLYAGGVYNVSSAPTVQRCIFTDNDAFLGAGVFNNTASSPQISNCIFMLNSVYLGGGVYNDADSNPLVSNCTFTLNWATSGAAMFNWDSSPTLVSCVLWGNQARRKRQLDGYGTSAPTLAYCCVQGGYDGPGNLDVDPRLTRNGVLTPTSPCIDAGDPAATGAGDLDIHREPRVVNGRVDIGADEYLDSDFDGLPNWWELQYFDDPNAADPNADDDGDGIANSAEFSDYNSNPAGGTWFVDATLGDDAWDGGAPVWQGAAHGPKRTIQAALDVAAAGDTALLADGEYRGVGNRELDFANRTLVLRGSGDGAIIDCDDQARAVDPNSIRDGQATLDQVTIRHGQADFGGALNVDISRLRLRDCVLESSLASAAGGGIAGVDSLSGLKNVTIRDCVTPQGVRFSGAAQYLDGHIQIDGPLTIENGKLRCRSTWFTGDGMLNLASDARLDVVGFTGAEPTVVRIDIMGPGSIRVEPSGSLTIEDATVNLSGIVCADPNECCADPNEAYTWGGILVEGSLVLRDATLRSTNVFVAAGDIGDGSTVRNNDINLLQIPPGWGGEFFAEGSTTIACNIIRSQGDRYLDIDPDPNASPAERPMLIGNQIYVEIIQGIYSEQGELLELRSTDYDYDSNDPALGNGRSGAYRLAESPGYSETWVLEELVIRPDAKVNLTNRPNLVYQNVNAHPESIYVKKVVLHENAVLNTGLQRLYYRQLVDQNDQPLDPNDQGNWTNGAQIVDAPLLGFSLKVIRMEDETEFLVRVQPRVRDPFDEQPPAGSEEPPKQGRIIRVAAPLPNNPDNHAMEMRTRDPNSDPAYSVAAHGAFARAGEDFILITFDYRFTEFDPNFPPELEVHLSDQPTIGENTRQVAVIHPPAPGRPGAVGSSRFATFHIVAPRGGLNFTRGTYIELVLRGRDSVVEIDDWDPFVSCGGYTCGDLDESSSIDDIDYLIRLAYFGAILEGDDARRCLDSGFSNDGYAGSADLMATDTLLLYPDADGCGPGFRPLGAAAALRDAAPVAVPELASLLIAGKRLAWSEVMDFLYAAHADGQPINDAAWPHAPASTPSDTWGYRANGRLIRDAAGTIYQLHGAQGLVRLSDAAVVIQPTDKLGPSGEHVDVGLRIEDGVAVGVPILDVAFDRDPGQANTVYVVPVVAWVGNNNDPHNGYKAAAKLTLLGNGDYTVDQLYGVHPDAYSNAEPSGGETDFQGLREIDVDADGNVYVLAAHAFNRNDWLLVYPNAGPAGQPTAQVQLSDPNLPDWRQIRNPTSLLVSSDPDTADRLYLTSATPNAADALSCVYTASVERVGGVVVDVAVTSALEIFNPDDNEQDYPAAEFEREAAVIDIAQDPATGRLFVLGFSKITFDDNDVWSEGTAPVSPRFTTPTLVVFDPDDPNLTSPIQAEILVNGHLALPISLIYLGGDTFAPGDVNCDGSIDFGDIDPFVLALIDRPAYETSYPDCDVMQADLNGDGAVDFADIDPFVQTLLGTF